MTIEEARKEITNSIQNIYEKEEANNIAVIVVEHLTNLSHSEMIVHQKLSLSEEQKKLLNQLTQRLIDNEPVQYIVNEAWFGGMKFFVDKNVLIPRPETEELVEWIVADYRQRKIDDKKIIDIGTGSGCIAITLKNKLPSSEIWACDISDEALTIARMNADTLKATIDFVPLNFLDQQQQKQLPMIDVIVGNPPYVLQRDKTNMRKNVTGYEPSIALFVPENDPLIFYKAIADFGMKKMNADGKIYLEIHEDLSEDVKNLFYSKKYKQVEVKKDLQGKNRMVKAMR